MRGPVSPEAVRQLLFACDADPSPYGLRDAALIQIMTFDRISAHGIGQLPAAPRLLVSPEGAERLQRWIAARGSAPGPLFARIRPSLGTRALSLSAINLIFAKRCCEAGVPPFTPQDFNRTVRAIAGGRWDSGGGPAPAGCTIPKGLATDAGPAIAVLRRMSSERRQHATKLLDCFARQLQPPATAMTVPWRRLDEECVATALRALAPVVSLRTLNSVRNCVRRVLKESQSWKNYTI